MPTSTSGAVKRIHVYGHVSASPQAVASTFGGLTGQSPGSETDLAIFSINPSAGIDPETISHWAAFDDFQTPRMVLVSGLDGQELDFEDAVMVANRVFDQLVTPYLVLHSDDGSPAALISLEDLTIRNYLHGLAVISESEPEHKELVADFAEEYQDLIDSSGEDAFSAGLLFPAIPVNLENGIGIDVLVSYLKQLK
jgi:hypothetical protein